MTQIPPTKPLLRGHFHQAMFFIALGACVPLVLKTSTPVKFIASLVYSMGVLTLFGVSALYHRITWNVRERTFMKKLDHAAIYVMIAGTFTPISLFSLGEDSSRKLLFTIWGVTALGIIQSLFFIHLPKIVSAVLYLFAAYLALPYLSEMKEGMGFQNTLLVVAGGVVYSLGALSYGLKWPKLKPTVFGYHELFHVLVCVAALLHFLVIDSLV